MLEGVDLSALEVRKFTSADTGSKLDLPDRSVAKEARKESSLENAPAQDAGTKVYDANCHCGAVRWTVTMPELKAANTCNCSHCTKVCSAVLNCRARAKIA